MGTLGSLIFLLVILAQGVSAVVVALKKRQEAREAERSASEPTIKAESKAPPTRRDPVLDERSTAAPAPSTDSARNDVVQRRRQQIEELRRQAMERKAGQIKATGKKREPVRISAEPVARQKPAMTATPKPPPPGGRPAIARVPDVVPPMAPALSRRPDSKQPSKPAASTPPVWGVGRQSVRARNRIRYRSMLGDQARLKDLIVLKEILDPPVTLREGPGIPD